MGKDNVFDSLVKDLSTEERRKMIEKMEQNIHVSQESLNNSVENEPFQTIEEEYKALSWLDKVFIIIKSLFLAKDKLEITKNILVSRLARQVSSVCPDFFDVKHRAATGEFSKLVVDVANSAEFIKKPMAVCFEMDKIKFYSLMGQLEFPGLQVELQAKINPWDKNGGYKSRDVQEVRRRLTDDLEMTLSKISRDERMRMMEMTRTLHYLYELSKFPFKMILGQFPTSAEGQPLAASFSGLAKPLTEFAIILKSFKNPPSVKLLEALFLLFYSQENLRDGVVLEELVAQGIQNFDSLIQKIRNFNKVVPLSDLLKVINHDPFYQIVPLGGGEDWFYFFRQYWQDCLTEKMRVFSRELALEETANELQRYWDVNSLLPVKGYSRNESFASFAFSFAALQSFFIENFQKKLYYPMKIILVEGNFYKKNNRVEYDSVFKELVKIGSRIKWFENQLLPEGEAGMKIRLVAHDYRDKPEELEREVLKVYNEINRDALLILEDSSKSLLTMGKLMNGVVMGNGGSYDTLSNFSDLGGRNNDELRQGITECADDIHKINHSLKDLMQLEKEKMDEFIKESLE